MTHTGCLLTTIDVGIGKTGPGPKGCGKKSGHTSFSPSTVDPPQPSGSASSGPIFARNDIHPSSVSRPQHRIIPCAAVFILSYFISHRRVLNNELHKA